jgi:hypothetical protein
MGARNRAAAKARVMVGRAFLGAEERSRMQTRSSHAGGAAPESEYLGPFDKWKPMTTVQQTFPDARIVLLIIVAACLAAVKGEAAGDDRSPFAAVYPDQRVFLDAIARERPRAVAGTGRWVWLPAAPRLRSAARGRARRRSRTGARRRAGVQDHVPQVAGRRKGELERLLALRLTARAAAPAPAGNAERMAHAVHAILIPGGAALAGISRKG